MTQQILLIDNYDSFVFNLARYLQELGVDTAVVRNDQLTVEEVRKLAPSAIVLSPGPCTPAESGISEQLVRELHQTIPILGVCLGHQAIVTAFGGNVIKAPVPIHGQTATIQHDALKLFARCPNPMTVGRYHSLIAAEASLPAALLVTSRTSDGLIMSVEHRRFPVYGVQFHPESILTSHGHQLLLNFLNLAGLSLQKPLPAGDLISTPTALNDFYQQQIAFDARRPL